MPYQPVSEYKHRKRYRLVISDYIELGNEMGFDLISNEVQNSNTPVEWRCRENNHVFRASYANVRSGWGCPYCSNRIPKTESDYHALATAKSLSWEGEQLPPTVTAKTEWSCLAQGHIFSRSYHSINSRPNSRCPVCAGVTRLTEDDYRRAGLANGIVWAGKELPANNHTPTRWVCDSDHLWYAPYNRIKQGHGCPRCGKVAIITKDDYVLLAHDKGLTLLGDIPSTVTKKAKWRCGKNHEFLAPYHSVKKAVVGCPICGIEVGIDKIRYKPEAYRALAERLGIIWVEAPVSTTTDKHWWICDAGHHFRAPYSTLSSGHGCPYCVNMVNGARVSKPQRALYEMVGGELNFAITPRRRADIAIQVDGVAIAIEYDAYYYHADKEQRGLARNEKMIALGWKVLCIKSNSTLPSPEQLQEAVHHLATTDATYAEIILDDWGKGQVFKRGK